MPPASARYAVVIPACNEEECIGDVLAELQATLDPGRFEIIVGVNGTSDRTTEVARAAGALVAETDRRGYGYGCQAAIDLLIPKGLEVHGYIFFAADGANDPRDIAALVAEHERGAEMVLGCRTTMPANWSAMNFHYVLANRCFGLLCGALTGRVFSDLGPLRLITRELFEALRLREWTYGWTIEAQVRAALMAARIVEVPVRERGRIGGEQKVSHVSWRRSLRVAAHIATAAVRTRFSPRCELTARAAEAAVKPVADLSAAHHAAR